MSILLPASIITTAATLIGPTVSMKPDNRPLPIDIAASSRFVYGSGGTSINVFIQGSWDAGLTWMDIMSFLQITTASNNQVGHVSRLNKLVPTTFRDGSGAAGSAFDGLIAPLMRAKAVSLGTYGGASTLTINLVGAH